MKNLKLLIFSLQAFLVLLMASGIQAQAQSKLFVSLDRYDSSYEHTSPYERQISLSFTNTTVEKALRKIAKEGNIRLSYNKKLIPNQKITVALKKVTVKTALK